MDYRQALVEALSKEKFGNRQKFVENKEVKKEDTEEFLEPRYDSRASFYKKAKVVTKDNGDEELYSYGTHVGGVRGGKPYSKGKFSQTTSRHQKDYFQQRGFDPKKVDVEESKIVEGNGEVPQSSYDIAEYIKDNVKGKNKLSMDEFNQLLDDAKSKILKGNEDNTDLDAEVRGILSYNGWDTDMESGDIFKAEESKKVTEGEAPLFKKKINKTDIKKVENKKLTETEDMLGRAYDYLDDIGISAADLLVKVSDFFGQDETNEFASTLMNESKKVEGKEPKRKVISQHNIKKVESKE